MKNKTPKVICLMMTSLDGKILGEKWGKSKPVELLKESFEKVHERIGIGAWIVGRKTMEKDFTNYARPVIRKTKESIPRTDFVARKNANTFAIALDGKGKLGWIKPDMQGDHVITILTEQVKDGYLAQLQKIGVSYIFAGKKQVNLETALEKLRSLFDIKKLMLEGGGHLNGSFLNEGLIDEFHQLLLPLADGSTENSSVFEIDEKVKKAKSTLLKLTQVKKIEHDVLWIKYMRKK
ncbi:RibD family protein [Pedobacter sp. BMA]|uniref:dihydrofolate reductase family protein n=1 Tax=Pedobacter sp. BMA TaxID=1663685 RepID=UPI000649D07A|nr:RibD family protein [Pedobacter sp. BMA]KLT65518.1 hypothetical protein AB669_10610 [Pedobacter sp. BMA]